MSRRSRSSGSRAAAGPSGTVRTGDPATVGRTSGAAGRRRGSLVRGGLGSLGVRAGGLALSLGLAIVLARSLGPQGYGTYTVVVAVVSLLAIPAQFGLPTLVIRETAKARAAGQWSLLRGVWRWATLAATGLSLSLAGAGGALVWILSDRFTSLQLATVVWGLVLVPLVALGALRAAALTGLRRVVQGQLPEQVLRPSLLLLLLGVVALARPDAPFTADRAMALHAVAAALAFAAGAGLLWRARPAGATTDSSREYQGREWATAALPLALIAGLQLVNHHTDVLMLGAFTSSEQVGLYRVAVTGSGLVAFGLQTMNMVVAPHFVQLQAAVDRPRLQHVVTRSARLILALALPVALALVLAGRVILTGVFGETYGAAHGALAILALGQLFNAAMGSVGTLLNMTGHERETMRGVAVAAILNLVLNALLIPVYGIEGAALATAASLVTWNWMLRAAVRRDLRIEPAAWGYAPGV